MCVTGFQVYFTSKLAEFKILTLEVQVDIGKAKQDNRISMNCLYKFCKMTIYWNSFKEVMKLKLDLIKLPGTWIIGIREEEETEIKRVGYEDKTRISTKTCNCW